MRMHFRFLLTAIIAVLLAGAAQATISNVGLTSPGDNSWSTDTTPTFVFEANSTTNATFSCELFIDGTGYGVNGSTANDTSTSITANATLSEGSMTWLVNCTDVNGTVSSSTYTLNIDATAPTIVLNSATSVDTLANTTIDLNVTDNADSVLDYTVFVNGSSNQTGTTANASSLLINLTFTTDGTYTVNVQAVDEAGNGVNSSSVSVTRDTAAPNVTSTGPSGTQSTSANSISVTLQASTDEDATCKYDSSNTSFASMAYTFSTTGGTSHSASASHSADGTYTWYVLCNDSLGNTMASAPSISYSVDVGAVILSGSGGQSLPMLSAYGKKISLNAEFGRFVFAIGREVHYMKVKGIKDGKVTLVFTSDPVEVILEQGEERNIDIDGDGEAEIYVKLEEFNDKSATFVIGEPKEIVPPEAESQAPEEEKTKEPVSGSGEAAPVTEAEPLREEEAGKAKATAEEKENGFSWGTALLVIVVLAAVAGAAWWFIKGKEIKPRHKSRRKRRS